MWHFKGSNILLAVRLPVGLKMSSQGPELWLITQVYPSVPAQFADPPLVKCWQLLLSFFSEEKNEYISHDTRLEVLPVPQEGDLGDLGVRNISSPFLLYKAQRLPEGCGPIKP